jgi:hypothetical protein
MLNLPFHPISVASANIIQDVYIDIAYPSFKEGQMLQTACRKPGNIDDCYEEKGVK